MASDTQIPQEKSFSNSVSEQDLTEEISKPSNKTFLGGYRNKLTGKVYHHAQTQTIQSPWKYGFILRFNRDTQTILVKEKAQQTAKDASTQVAVKNSYFNTDGDRIIEASDTYVSADEIKEEKIKKTVLLQKNIKRWLAQKEMLQKKHAMLMKLLWEIEQNKLRSKDDDEWIKNMQERKLNPKFQDDFQLLFSDLKKWWDVEAKSISDARSGADWKAAMWMLTNAEVKHITDINRKRISSECENVSQNREFCLKSAAMPKEWRGYKTRVKVETGNTLRAKQLHCLYQTLSMNYISSQDRVDVLTCLKETVKPYHSKLTNSLINLVNREIDLHLRGIKGKNLEGLQTRIRDLFWQFAKKPTFNPEIQKLKPKGDGSTPHILCCVSCQNFYIVPSISRSKTFEKCKQCLSIENEAWVRKDAELYKRMLDILRQEENKTSASGIIFAMQPGDIGHLVENIWKRQSCISGSKDENEFELIRYNLNKCWTPWNCLLVTKEEAITLKRIPHSDMKYDQKFKASMSVKHAEARRYFSSIPRFWPYLLNVSSNQSD